jgi:hypothetical protein
LLIAKFEVHIKQERISYCSFWVVYLALGCGQDDRREKKKEGGRRRVGEERKGTTPSRRYVIVLFESSNLVLAGQE